MQAFVGERLEEIRALARAYGMARLELFGHNVDVVLPPALNNRWFRREVEKTRRVVFVVKAGDRVA